MPQWHLPMPHLTFHPRWSSTDFPRCPTRRPLRERRMSEIPESAKPALDMLRGVGGDDMVTMLLRTFVQFADERVDKLAEEAHNARWSEVASIAHALKSSARQLGALAMAD